MWKFILGVDLEAIVCVHSLQYSKDGRVPASLIMQLEPAKGSAAGSRAALQYITPHRQ